MSRPSGAVSAQVSAARRLSSSAAPSLASALRHAPVPVGRLEAPKRRELRFRVPVQHRLRLAGFGEPLERVGAGRLEQPVTRYRIAFGEHQRLVDQRAQMIERRPRIDAVVVRHVLRGLEREAAGEHGEPPEHGLLVGGEERMAPFQRGTKCLVTA